MSTISDREVAEVNSLLILLADPKAFAERLESITKAYSKAMGEKQEASLVKKQVELSKNDALRVQGQVRKKMDDLRVATLEHDRRRKEANSAEGLAQHAIDGLKERIQALDHREALLFRREQELKQKKDI
jgi:hypothetical protein